jgi:hypothetical protein
VPYNLLTSTNVQKEKVKVKTLDPISFIYTRTYALWRRKSSTLDIISKISILESCWFIAIDFVPKCVSPIYFTSLSLLNSCFLWTCFPFSEFAFYPLCSFLFPKFVFYFPSLSLLYKNKAIKEITP